MNKKTKNTSIHPYIPHLLDDIKAAHRDKETNERDSTPESIEEYLEQVDRWINGECGPEHTLGYYCGLKSENFPPQEQLSDRDIELVCNAFEELLYSWNAGLSIPESVPLRFRYTLMVSLLKDHFIPLNSGFFGFDYCTGYAPECALKEYCPCLEIWNNDDDDDSIDPDKLSGDK